MAGQVWYSDNDSDTFADALKAVGLAEVLRAWLVALKHDAAPIWIEDKGAYYQITLPSPLDEGAVAAIADRFVAGRGQALISKKQREKAGQEELDLTGFQYEDEVARRNEYFARLEKLSKADRARFGRNPNAEEFAELGLHPPNPDLGLYIYINHFKAAENYNVLLEQWRGNSLERFRLNLGLLLTAFAAHPNRVNEASEEWAALAKAGRASGKPYPTQLQLINPASGKGANAFKADAIRITNLDGPWLAEYLKFVGLFTIAAPLMIASSKDRKTYVLRPEKIEIGVLRQVIERFRATFYSGTAVKLDILAVLRFTIALVRYLGEAFRAGADDDFLRMFDLQPRVADIARGFDVGFYKDMGSAYATMNLATINLPSWLAPITSSASADATLAFLQEHEQVIGGIKSTKGDEGSEEMELLRRYRDFLSGQDSTRFFDFAARYGDYYLARRHRGQWLSQFTTEGMKTLMDQAREQRQYSHILAADGFQSIATAIRFATVIAQYRAARGQYPYDVRYGLGQDLLRAAAYPDEFFKMLSAFIQSYNAENARIDERIAKGSLPNTPNNRRPSVKTDHINEIVRLVDEYGDSELICKMLVAYGYSRDVHIPDPGGQPPDPSSPRDDK